MLPQGASTDPKTTERPGAGSGSGSGSRRRRRPRPAKAAHTGGTTATASSESTVNALADKLGGLWLADTQSQAVEQEHVAGQGTKTARQTQTDTKGKGNWKVHKARQIAASKAARERSSRGPAALGDKVEASQPEKPDEPEEMAGLQHTLPQIDQQVGDHASTLNSDREIPPPAKRLNRCEAAAARMDLTLAEYEVYVSRFMYSTLANHEENLRQEDEAYSVAKAQAKKEAKISRKEKAAVRARAKWLKKLSGRVHAATREGLTLEELNEKIRVESAARAGLTLEEHDQQVKEKREQRLAKKKLKGQRTPEEAAARAGLTLEEYDQQVREKKEQRLAKKKLKGPRTLEGAAARGPRRKANYRQDTTDKSLQDNVLRQQQSLPTFKVENTDGQGPLNHVNRGLLAHGQAHADVEMT